MLDHDDKQFEARLKEFRPLPAEPLPVGRTIRARRRRFVLAVCGAGSVVIVLVAAVIARQRADQLPSIHHNPKVADAKVKVVDVVEVMPPISGHRLTIRSANELLAHAPSVKAALDELAFQRRERQMPSGTQSALAVLGKEDFEL